MEMRFRRQFMAASDGSQTSILDSQKALDRRRLNTCRPNWSPIVQLGPNQRLERNQKRLLVLTPRRTGQRLNDLQALPKPLRHLSRVGREGEKRVKVNS